ncbi:PilZ domain-containing protein [bacterium]|nr:PilZ domain-containing protein [bacterium]
MGIISLNQELLILSSEVTNATRGNVTEVFDDESFQIKLKTKENYTIGENVNLFAVSGSGIVYISSNIQDIKDLDIKISRPEKSSLIQRREYTRVEIHKNILINYQNKNIRAEIIDISAGGMKLTADTEMFKNIDYKTDINLDTNLFISCLFRPVRIIYDENLNKFVVSGKFKLIKNVDRVALMQFCMKKQSEIQNK